MRLLRSLMLGDCQHYASPYMRGVAQAMNLLEVKHVEVSIRSPARTIAEWVRTFRPDVVWTHMLLWPPPGAPKVSDLIAVVSDAAKRGAKVIIHDGDAKESTRYPQDISGWCSLALLNHGFDRSAWRVPTLRWPYFAMVQPEIAAPVESLRCDLFFAGRVGSEPVYAARSALLEAIRARGVNLRMPPPGDNTIDRTPEISASADAVLGFGRPGVRQWLDVRCFQYTGAGAILLHDDVGGFLEPWVHYVPYRSGDAASVVEALDKLRRLQPSERQGIRERAFSYVQANHSSVARVRQVLGRLYP